MSWGAGRRDDSESAIAGALAKAGCDIEYATRRPYDLIVGRAGMTYLLEVKSLFRTKKPKAKPLTESQIDFKNSWRGHYAVVATPAEALKAVGLGVKS